MTRSFKLSLFHFWDIVVPQFRSPNKKFSLSQFCSQIRTRRGTAGRTMSTSTAARKSRSPVDWNSSFVWIFNWTCYHRARSTSLASSLRRTSELCVPPPGSRSGTNRGTRSGSSLFGEYLPLFWRILYSLFSRAPSLPTSRAPLLRVVYFNPWIRKSRKYC